MTSQEDVDGVERGGRPSGLLLGGVGLVVVAVVLRLAQLTTQSLWYDEGYSLFFSSAPDGIGGFLTRLFSIGGSEKFQPLYNLVLEGWRSVTGSSETTLRLLSVVIGSAAVVVIGLTARRWYGPRHALWTVALAALSGIGVLYSQEVRPYALILLLGSLQVAAFLAVAAPEEPPTRWRLAAFWVVTGIGYLTSVMLGAFAAAMFVAHLVAGRRTHLLVTWAPVVVVGAVISLFYAYGYLTQAPGNISELTRPLLLNIVYVPYGLVVGPTFGPPAEALRGSDQVRVVLSYWRELLALVVVLALLAIAIVPRLLRPPESPVTRRVDRLLLVTLVAGFLLTIVAVVATKLNWQPRHSLYLLVPLTLLLPLAARRPAAGTPRWLGWIGTIALVALIALNAFAVARYLFDPAYARDDYRAAAGIIEAERGAAGRSVLLWGRTDLLAYYGDDQTIDGTGFDHAAIADEIAAATGGASPVVVAIERDFYWDPERGVAALEDAMAGRYRLVRTERVPYFVIETYEPR